MTATTPNRRRRLLVPVLIFALAVALIAVLYSSQQQPSADPAASTQTDSAKDQQQAQTAELRAAAERRDANDPLAAGLVEAPVVLVAFSDYQCPYCARWNADTLPALKKHVDAGDLRIEWRDLNIFGEASERASRASYAAGLQGKFWEYHEGLFPGGEKRSEKQLSEKALVELAGSLKLDTKQFTKDLNSKETVAEVTRNSQLGHQLGASSTPVFLVGGVPISGAQPTEVFEQAIATALSQAAKQ